MRIPPSTIVMGLVTALPFGLAIRDTAQHRTSIPPKPEIESIHQASQQAELARLDRRAARLAGLATIFGTAPASMGALFDGISLGAPAESFLPDETHSRIMDEDLVDVLYETDTTLRRVHVSIALDACVAMHDKLAQAWGTAADNKWLDPATHQRASFSTQDCTLTFSKYIDPDAWVDALPLTLGATAGLSAGVGRGEHETETTVFADGALVVSDTDSDSQLAIRDALSAKLKTKAIQDAHDPQVWTWNSVPPVKLDLSGAARFSVMIGRQPQ